MKSLKLVEGGIARGSIELVDDRLLCAPTIRDDSVGGEVATKLLAMAVRAFPSGRDPRLILLDTYGTRLVSTMEEAALSLGFRRCGEKHLYVLSLDAIPAETWEDEVSVFSYRDMEDLGVDFFVDLFREIQPESIDSFSLGGVCDHRKELARLARDDRYIAHLWLVAFLNDDPVGMILCGSLGKGRQQEGTLQFIGVRPRYRRLGYGSLLFRKALLVLKEHGMQSYIDSTASGNLPMLRIFDRHGGRRDCIQYMYRLPLGEDRPEQTA